MYIRIDAHVHGRDDEDAYKETIIHLFKIANEQGVKVIFDMPNTYRPIKREADVLRRLSLVPREQEKNYFLYLGLTIDEDQLEEAVYVYNKYKQAIGFKLFTGRSNSKDLSITNEDDQKQIYKKLTVLGYKGVVAVHCEKESFLKPELWDPSNPISHCLARPKQAEIESTRDQIRFVRETNFQGTLHIVHVSCSESVEVIDAARKEIKITCGVTPHHIMWDYVQLNTSDGLIYKMNPPLRSHPDVLALRECLKAGQIDWIETDHAPHPISEKLFSPYLSGFPSLCLYKDFVERFLPNIGISEKQIKKLTHDNICKTFRLKI